MPPAPDPAALRARYLDLLENILTGAIIEDPPLPTPGYKAIVAGVLKDMFGVAAEPPPETLRFNQTARDNGLDWPSRAFTMIGRKRLRSFRGAIETVLADNIAGDIVETGVWRGGASILARAVLAAYGQTTRRVYVCDSFAGLPPPDTSQYPADAGSTLHEEADLAVSLDQVQRNFAAFDLLDDQVVFVPGWFRDTMPSFPASQIAVLRLDGDMYESTIDPLRYLYDRVSPGGWVIVDDYFVVPACQRAVHDFLDGRGVSAVIENLDGGGVLFRKPL